MLFVVIIVAVVVVAAVSFVRLRPGGPGPAVNWVPRSMRGRMNSSYEKRGWQKPFDADGNRNPDRDPI